VKVDKGPSLESALGLPKKNSFRAIRDNLKGLHQRLKKKLMRFLDAASWWVFSKSHNAEGEPTEG